MAMEVPATLVDYEVRAVNHGVSKKTKKPWLTLVLENKDADQLRVSVPEDEQESVLSADLRRGELVSIGVVFKEWDNRIYMAYDGIVARGASAGYDAASLDY